jgi:GNAT superfamily N-acetyltransferase
VYVIREAQRDDVPAIATLMQRYMRETYRSEWHGSARTLADDGFGAQFRLLVAERRHEVVALLGWQRSYDLHHCLAGGQVLDLYVLPEHRSRGLAMRLVALASRIIQCNGGAFIKGGAVDNGTGPSLYSRFAPAFGNDYILGGRAFRHVASLVDLPMRELMRSLPKKEWNFEP